MLNAAKSVFLVLNVIDVFACNNLSLFHGFDCVLLLGILLKPRITHIAKSACLF